MLVVSFVNPLDDEGIGECFARLFERDLVTPTVARRLGVIPFEIIGFHMYTGYPYNSRLPIGFVAASVLRSTPNSISTRSRPPRAPLRSRKLFVDWQERFGSLTMNRNRDCRPPSSAAKCRWRSVQ